MRTLFEQFGDVDKVSIPINRENGRPRGFAFIEMPNEACALRAIQQLNRSTFLARKITVNAAREKGDRS